MFSNDKTSLPSRFSFLIPWFRPSDSYEKEIQLSLSIFKGGLKCCDGLPVTAIERQLSFGVYVPLVARLAIYTLQNSSRVGSHMQCPAFEFVTGNSATKD